MTTSLRNFLLPPFIKRPTRYDVPFDKKPYIFYMGSRHYIDSERQFTGEVDSTDLWNWAPKCLRGMYLMFGSVMVFMIVTFVILYWMNR